MKSFFDWMGGVIAFFGFSLIVAVFFASFVTGEYFSAFLWMGLVFLLWGALVMIIPIGIEWAVFLCKTGKTLLHLDRRPRTTRVRRKKNNFQAALSR